MKKLLILFLPALCMMGTAQTVSIKINDSITYQEIVGFGAHGSMNVWWSGGPFYNTAFLNNVIDDLGLTATRNEFYDYDMSIYTDKQKDYYIAMKNKAASSNEPLTFIQTVWSPQPQWKANNSVVEGPDPTKNYLLASYYDEYSNYCADYISTTLKNDCGIDLYAFSLQNEPAFNEPYQSCQYTPAQYNDLLKVAGPIFRTKCPNVKLFGAEDMGGGSTLAKWTSVIFNDPVAVNYLDVCAVHGYTDGINPATGDAPGWTAMYNTASSKKKQLWMTETSGFSDTWTGSSGALDLGNAIYLALKFGKISTWTWWQLGDTGNEYSLMGSKNGTPTKRYYVSKNFYRYIRPKALQVESYSPSTDVSVVAFKNPGNSSFTAVKPQLTVVLINKATSSKTVSLTGRSIPATMKAYRTSSSENCVTLADATTSSISLPAQSITTLVYQSVNKSPTINQPADIVIVQNTTSKTVSLTNVTVGSGETGTPTVTAISSDKTLIPGAITVTGTAPNLTLTFSPAAGKTGNATIKVFVKDAGTDILNTTVVTFNVKVIAAVNVAPTIDPIINYTVGLTNKSKKHYIWFSGISDGNGGSQNIIKPALTFSNQSIIRLPFVNYTVNATYGYIEFYPDQLGTSTVTVKVQDDGGTDIGGTDSKTITFNLTVVADAPLLGIKGNNEQTLAVFPNPASDIINVILPDDSYSSIQVIDMTGKEVMRQHITASQIQMDASGLSNGIYIVIAKGEAGTTKAKVFVNK